jgi:hypothetical protein
MNLLSDLRKEVHLQPCDLVIHRSTNPATESRIVPENAGSRFISSQAAALDQNRASRELLF